MKKTLITLAALAMASVASAAEYTNPTGTLSGAFSSSEGEFTMIAILDWDAAMGEAISDAWDDRTDIISSTSSHSTWGQMWSNGPTLFNGNNGTTLELGVQKDGTDQAFTTAGASDGNNISLTESNYGINGQLAISYTFTTDGVVTVGALKSDGTTWATASYSTGWDPYQAFDTIVIGAEGVITSLVTYDSVLSTEAMTSAAREALGIPEPTTATLSLLALAGLAARRRRK